MVGSFNNRNPFIHLWYSIILDIYPRCHPKANTKTGRVKQSAGFFISSNMRKLGI